MPTATERAEAEKNRWVLLSEHWTRSAVPDLWDDRPPTEKDVIGFHDPQQDLMKRTRDWGYDLPRSDLSALATFAAGLSSAEAEAWDADKPDIATRAYEARRFLLGDRIIHWAVPWLDAVRRRHPGHQETANSDRGMLLELADDARVAPSLPGREGIRVAGEDSYGPIHLDQPLDRWLASLWSGMVLLGDQKASATSLAVLYETESERWTAMATDHPGSAEIWEDLSLRATATAERLL
jgi:hypothetical protein